MCLDGELQFMLAKKRIHEWHQEAARVRTADEAAASERRRRTGGGCAARERPSLLGWIRLRAGQALNGRVW